MADRVGCGIGRMQEVGMGRGLPEPLEKEPYGQGSQVLFSVLKKPGLQGGQRVFTPDAGSFAAPSRSSLQIFGLAHLYMSCVCRNEISPARPVVGASAPTGL